MRCEIDLVDDQQIAARDAGSPFSWHLVAARDVDDVNRVVDELAAVLRREVVTAALDDQQIGTNPRHEISERQQVRADVLADRGVRAAAGFDGSDLRGGKRFVAVEELGILAREDVVGDHAEPERVAQLAAQREHQRGLAAADRTADADGEGAA